MIDNAAFFETTGQSAQADSSEDGTRHAHHDALPQEQSSRKLFFEPQRKTEMNENIEARIEQTAATGKTCFTPGLSSKRIADVLGSNR